MHRKAVDRVRSAEASTRRDRRYHQQNQPVAHDATAEAAHASLEARRVRGALGTLTEVQREALELAYFGGYTHTEVATMLDLPVGTAKTRIRDGLISLRDAMGVGSMNSGHPRAVRRLRRRRARRHRAGPVRAAPRRLRATAGPRWPASARPAACWPRPPSTPPPASLRDRVLADIATVRPLPPLAPQPPPTSTRRRPGPGTGAAWLPGLVAAAAVVAALGAGGVVWQPWTDGSSQGPNLTAADRVRNAADAVTVTRKVDGGEATIVALEVAEPVRRDHRGPAPAARRERSTSCGSRTPTTGWSRPG